MKKNVVPIIVGSVAMFAAAELVSCSNSKPADEALVAYDGPTSFAPAMENVESDSVFEFNGTKVPTVRINRSAVLADSNFFVSVNVYASADNERINGTLAKYIADAAGAFVQTSGDAVQAIEVDSTANIAPAGLVSVADSIVAFFNNSVFPQAQNDSVIATNLAVDLRPMWADGQYITYAMNSQSYFGGAHAEDDFYLLSFDAKTGTALGFYNLVAPDKQQEMRQRLLDVISRSKDMSVEQYLAMENQWAGNERANRWTVQNFPIYHVAVTGQGYVFFYPKYSIAPGSDGCPVYVLPQK